MSISEKPVRNVGGNESRATGDEDLHVVWSFLWGSLVT